MIPEPDLPVPPDDFVGRNQQIDAFRQALQQGLIAGRTSSFAVLGDSGVGKSSLLLKFGALCSEPSVAMLPVFISGLNDIHDYLRFAEILLDKFVDALLTWPKMQTHVRRELQNWRFKRANLVDDLQNIRGIGRADLALAITNQFRSFGVEGMNYSICFSATADYLAQTKGPADPVPRFYTKLHLEPFPVEETVDYVRSVFSTSLDTTARIAAWLHGKTLGHPSFVTFACRHWARSAGNDLARDIRSARNSGLAFRN